MLALPTPPTEELGPTLSVGGVGPTRHTANACKRMIAEKARSFLEIIAVAGATEFKNSRKVHIFVLLLITVLILKKRNVYFL